MLSDTMNEFGWSEPKDERAHEYKGLINCAAEVRCGDNNRGAGKNQGRSECTLK
jgi:hypothetical protein